MPIVIGLGKDANWNDPLNIYSGSPTPSSSSAPKPSLADNDRRDLVNTIIAEAAGEGDEGMAAVANVIRNRSERRGKTPGDVVREPNQFTGYSKPGPDALKAMDDPAVRQRAESILDAVLAGNLPDQTGGADHYHADSVSPDWASAMAETARVGRHRFYRAGSGPDTKLKESAFAPGIGKGGEDPFAAVLKGETTAPKAAAEDGSSALLSKLQAGKPDTYITDMAPGLRSGLTAMFDDAPDFVRKGLDILSGARTPEKQAQIIADNAGKYGFDRSQWLSDVKDLGPVEAGKKWRPTFRELGLTKNIGMPGGSRHQHGDAADLGWNGGAFSTAPKEVHDWVHANAGKYDLSFPMAHEPWHVETKTARSGGETAASTTTPASVSGKSIVIDENFQSNDPMGLMSGGNPFTGIADQSRQAVEAEKTATADQFEQNRIRAYNEQHNAAVDQQRGELEQQSPGRYQEIAEEDLPAFQQKWKDENQSEGVVGDAYRILKSGTIGVGQTLSSLADTVFNKIPGGKRFLEASDQIDRWAMGQTLDQRMDAAKDRTNASVTDRQQDADAKNWWNEKNGWFGPAWGDPRSYLRVVGESIPATVVTMAPGGILARGAYLRALAAGGSQRAAAATAARTATLSGAILEGGMGGADSAANVRERIGQLPREQILATDAAKSLIEGGMSEDDAIKAVTEDAATQAFVISGVATGMFGGLGDRALAKILAEGVGGGVARRILEGAARGMVGEGLLEEAPQGAAAAIAENAAVRSVDPNQSLTEGVGEAVASGIAGGGAMGGGMGAVGGAGSRRPDVQQGADASSIDANADETPPPAPSGPVGRSVQHAEQQLSQRQAAANPAPVPQAASGGRPELGATVRVDAEGIEPFMGRVDGYEGDEAVIIDGASGEVYQIPIANLTQIAASPERLSAENPKPTTPQPVNDTIPEFSTDPALEPQAPQGSEVRTEPLPPQSEQKPATERFPSTPNPGERVLVDDKNGGRFAARVRSYEGDEALVTTDDGKDLQVPVSSLFVSKLTPKQVEKQDEQRNPPIEREKGDAGPNSRAVHGRTVVMPDDRHARLYDLGRERMMTRRTLGASQLDLNKVNNPEIQKIAEAFKVSPQAVESMADDYRYRIERAAKEARSDLPQHVAPVNANRLAQWQRERAKLEPETAAQVESASVWWDAELTAPERKRILDAAGVKRSERVMWGGFTPAIRKKLEPFRTQPKNAEQVASTFTTAKGSVYTVHADGTTTRNKAARNDPGHEGDSGVKARTARTIYVDTNAAALSAAGLNGLGDKGARVAIRGNKATLVTWNRDGGWGASAGSRDIQFSTTPKVGAYPLELWQSADDVPGYEAYARMHAGNAITTIDDGSASPASEGSLDAAAHDAATSPQNELPEPTQAQKEAGNYKLGHIRLGGLDISIENPAGSERKGTDPNGKVWSVEMKSHYGYIKGTVGRDKDHIDVFVKPGTETLGDDSPVFVIDQHSGKGAFDEHKVMVGFDNADAARKGYLANFTKGWRGLGAMTQATFGDFKKWLAEGDTGKPFARQEKADEGSAAPDLRVDDERGAGSASPKPDRARSESGAGGNSRDSAARRRDGTGTPVEPSRPDVSASARNADADQALNQPPGARNTLFDNNKIFSADAVEKARARLRAKMSQINSGIDPEMLIDGMTIAGAYIEAGVRNFSEYANRMTEDFGDAVKPYLLSFWEGARSYPGIDTAGMTSRDESARLHAELNEALPASEVKALGNELAKPSNRSPRRGRPEDRTLNGDYGVDHIDAYSEEGERAKEAFLKDGTSYLKAVASSLTERGYAPQNDRMGRPMKPVNANPGGIAMSGDVGLNMRHAETGANVWVRITASSLRGIAPTSPSGVSIVMRASARANDTQAVDGTNNWVPIDVTAGQLATMIDKAGRGALEQADFKRQAAQVREEKGTPSHEPAELEGNGAQPLAGVSADPVPGTESGRETGDGTGSGGRADLSRGDRARGKRVQPGRGLADDERTVSPANGKRPDDPAKPDAKRADGDAQRAEDDAGEVGPFGPILRGYEGRWREAALELERRQTGDAIGALRHKDVGPIDLVWGKAGTNNNNGAGLAKLIAWHPEVLNDLQGFIDRLTVDQELSTPRRIQLRDETGHAALRLDFDGIAKTWLLTAFELDNRRATPNTKTLNELWGNAGRGARTDTAPAKPSDDRTSRGTGKDNISETLQNVQSGAVPAQQQPADFAISEDDKIGQGGAKTKFANNISAIRLLRQLEQEQRPATRDEQAVLAKWVGWGGLRSAFARDDGTVSKGWEKQATELRELLSPAEYRAAEASTRNAHYTAPEVASAIWNIAQRLGFRGGQVLEPSVGAGNFLGLMPGNLRGASRVTGVELDHITGGIAKHLYPGANIQAPVGFETFSMPDGYFDLAIGNPPFGSERLYDKGRPHLKLSIHNFFFAKSIEGLRPGGLLAMVVTNRFLDNGSMVTRQMIARHADLVGAIRLPNTAFLQNAGTEVTTDIVLFQKRQDGASPGSKSWLETVEYRGADGKQVPLNRYFVENPQMMLGDFGAYGTMYGPDEPALIAPKGQDLPAELAKAIERLPADIAAAPGLVPVISEQVADGVESVHVGSMFMADGAVHQRMPDSLGQAQSKPVEFANEKAKERVSGMIRVRDVFARLRRAQIDENASETQVENLRALLNKAYDAFAKRHGPINADGNKRLFRDDPTWPQISALENNFDKGISDAVAKSTGEKARPASADKAPIFRKRTQQPYHPPTHAETAKDALAQTLNERGRVDMRYMQSLYGKPEAEIAAELGPLLFRVPGGAYEAADAYLSGNVKAKLAEAERAAETDSDFRRNVAALRDVIPADIEPVDIDVKPGAPWVPGKHVADFANHITGGRGATAVYSKAQGQWALEVPRASSAADAMWGTDRASVSQIVAAALNGKSAQVYTRDANGNPIIDQPATDAANEKVERIKTEWQRWLWDDDARRDELARLYNDTFNTDVVRVFDGSHLTLPGKVSDDIITLRPHQKSFVWRTLQSSVALADHTVGAGKTFALIASIMEKRRTGQAKKPLLTVPNHLVGQWAADFVKLYPGAKVLAATKRDFERENRKRLFARITTGDWDVVIVAHSQFGLIGVSPEVEAKFIEQQIADMEASITDLRRQTGEKSRNVAQLAKQRQNLETKLKTLLNAGRKDDGLYFDDLGVDALYVDEFHEFKNLPFVTGMQRVAGLGNPAGSKKATDMYLKIQQVIESTGGNIVPATGTPLSNTMAEMFTLMRYLAPKALQRLGISHFDAWARVFGDVVTDWELSPSGQYKLNTRFARFVNIPELMTQYLSFADVISNDDIKAQLAAQGKTLPLPKVKGGKPTNITVERSRDQASYIGEGRMGDDGQLHFPQGSLVYRAENLPRKAEKGADNMLKVMSDARKAALDMRLIDPAYGDHAGSKVARAADEMTRIYRQWDEQKGTQLVFIDLSTPKKAKAKEEAALRDLIKRADEGDEAAQEKLDAMSPDEFLALDSPFSVYDDLRQKLIDRGVPANEIAFIHDANTELQKEELFGKVRSGRVRFLFGSTPKMGAGTNVQNRLVGLHHLDAPWRPSDLEQRDGRIIRQGNELYAADPERFEVEILRYATKNTLDARQWQGIEAKARFIGQVRKGDVKTRAVEDIAGEAANAAEMKAAASGNPLILEEMDTRRRLRQLEAQATEHEREQHRIKSKIRDVDAELELIENRRDAVASDAAAATEFSGKPFTAVVAGETVEKPKEFGAALLDAMRKAVADGVARMAAGSIGGFKLALVHNYGANFAVEIRGAQTFNVTVSDIGEQDATGLAMQVSNTVRRMQNMPAMDAERSSELVKQRPALEKQLGPWLMSQELADTAAKHRRLIDALKPKAKTGAAAQPQDALAPKENKRPDPVVATENNLKSASPPSKKPGETIRAWARDTVSRMGRETGHEYLVAVDDDGQIVEYGTAGERSATGMSNKLMGAILNPDRRLVIYHNHPRNSTLSVSDLTYLAAPGLYSIWAIGSGGKEARVALTERAKGPIVENGNRSQDVQAAMMRLRQALKAAEDTVRAFLHREVGNGTIDPDTARAAHDEVLPVIAQLAGIVDYHTNEPYDLGQVPGLDRALDSAALVLAKDIFNEPSATTNADAGVRRSTEPLRHIGELEGVAGGSQQVAAQQSGQGGLREGSAGDYSPKGANRVTERRIIGELNGRLTDLQPALLKAIPLNYFTELARPNMSAVGDYLRVKRLMDAFRGKKHAAADEIAGAWLKYARLGLLGKDKTKARELSDLMHDSTLAGVDPSQTDDETKAKPGYDILRKRYLALAPAGRELYGQVRNAYRAQADELDAILLDNVRKAQQIAADRADERYKKTLDKIRDAKLDPIARRKAEEDAASAHKAETTKASWAAKARMTKMRIAFESSRVPAPYFPLGRFGRYFVTVRDMDGSVISFSKFERAADRDRFAVDAAREYPAAKVEKGVMEQGSDLRRAMDPRMVAEIEEILGGAGVDAEVMDMIWQRYLETMPDLSTRKRFIHRAGTAGYSTDALRVFSSHMFHAAHQMAKVKYGLELQDLVNKTTEQAREADDQTRAMTLANELSKRHDWVMNPTGSKAAQVMTSTAFVWFLAASPASAVLNMTQTVMMGLPILAARFGGLSKAAAALARASMDSVSGRGSVTKADLTREEAAALEVFYDSGLIDRTQSHDLAGVGETGVEYTPLRARAMAVISWAFHRAEVWNREVTALAAYRMARDAGQDHLTAIDTAHDLTWKTHFDYSNSSRPALMQNDLAKVALVFRQHNVNMLYRVFRDIQQSMAGETPQARREARYQLAGVVGMMTLMAGVSGTIGFNLIMALAGMLFGDDDDPLDFAERFKADVVDILGPELGGVVLNGVPGHYLGIDLSNRIGMPDLWFRSPARELQGRDEYQYWLSQALGAAVGLGEQLWTGASLVLDGETARGIEMMAPKAVRDIMKSYRYAGDGLTTVDGNSMMSPERIGWNGILATALGFTPAAVSETWDRNTTLKNAETRIMDERQRLINKWGMAAMDGDKEAIRAAVTAIVEWNKKPLHAGVPIKKETLQRSIKTRAANEAKRNDGTLIRNEILSKRLREALSERIY